MELHYLPKVFQQILASSGEPCGGQLSTYFWPNRGYSAVATRT